ncbi:MAG: MarR family transcriptional regulator [Dehalococcoidia bacterium]|jgi:DNA-binding MarR family transcriptional regulator
MTVDLESQNLVLRLWFLMHRDYSLLRRCEDRTYAEQGLTMEQFSVLVAMKYIGNPVRPTDVAEWIGRSPNSVSMIIDRMVKAGLVRRIRDKSDRRVVRLVTTSKAESAVERSTQVGWEFIQKIMSPLSHEDRHTFARLFETLRYETLNYLHPGQDIEAMEIKDDKNHADMMNRLFQHVLPSTAQANRQGSEKGKTRRI